MTLGGNAGPLAPFMENPSVEQSAPNDSSRPLGFPREIGNNAKTFNWSDAAARTGAKGIKVILPEGEKQFSTSLNWSGLQFDDDKAYQFSFWYKSPAGTNGSSSAPAPSCYVKLGAFTYPQSFEWVQAKQYFTGQTMKGRLDIAFNHYGNPKPAAMDASTPLPTAMGNTAPTASEPPLDLELQRHAPAIIYIDDFQLRELNAADYKGNLLWNPGFEQGIACRVPPGYWGVDCKRIGSRGAIDDQERRSGKRSLRIDCPKAQYEQMTFRYDAVPVRPNDVCNFSLWAKSNKSGAGMTVRVYTNGRRWTSDAQWRIYRNFAVGTEWRKIDFMFIVPGPQNADYDPQTSLAYCTFHPNAKEPGAVWIDDISFVIETPE